MSLNFLNKKIILFLITIAIFLFFTFFNDKFKNKNQLLVFENCNLPEIKFLPKQSTIVVGHAYGSPLNANKDAFFSKKIHNFLNKNKKNIKEVIFTGDVFWEPSAKKWKKLYEDYKGLFDIHIAPGNHDVDRLSKINIFKMSNFKTDDFYKINTLRQKIYLIENSIINNWEINPELIQYLNNNPNNNFVLFRHNIPVQELVQFANSKSLISQNLSTVKNLYKKISKINNLIIISGDSGAFKELPRITCHTFKNIKFITNGIGDIEDDIILILNKNEIFTYNLR